LDDPDLALRLGHRCACLFNALQMVPPGNVIHVILPATVWQGRRSQVRRWGDLEVAPP
jgi:hypothetical protein